MNNGYQAHKDNKALRILVVSPVVAPTADSEAFCGGKMMLGLLRKKCEISILTLSRDSNYLNRLDESSCWTPLANCTYQISASRGMSKIGAAVCAIRYKTITYPRWIFQLLQRAKTLHAAEKFDVIYTRSLPIHAHIAGFWLSKSLGIPWIANINDPWDWHWFPHFKKPKREVFYETVSNFWMRRTIRRAALLTYPSERLWKFHERISGLQHPGVVLPHIGYGFPAQESSRVFTLVHAGRLGLSTDLRRSPVPLLQALKIVRDRIPESNNKLRVYFVGGEEKRIQELVKVYGLDEIIKCTGEVSYEESLRYIALSHVCLLLEMDMDEGIYLPSKLTDYIVSNKPVLAISPANGTVSDLAQMRGICCVSGKDPEAISRSIIEQYTEFTRNNLIRYAPEPKLREQFDEGSVIQRFLDSIASLVSPR